MSLSVKIPPSLTKNKIPLVVNEILTPDLEPKSDVIIFDLTEVTWIDPSGIAALYNIGKWIDCSHNDNIKVTFRIAEKGTGSYKNKRAMEYLEDCGFFEEFFGASDIYKENHAYRSTTLPIRTLGVEQSFSWRYNVLKRWLQESTGRNLEFSGIQVGVEEIFNNIRDHSNRNIGCVFGQYFPNNDDRLVITISDFGLGIPAVMRQKYGDFKDHELVLKALEEGVSTESTPGNRGAGLPNIMKSLTSNKIGTVHILTNYAKIVIRDGKVNSAVTTPNFYPGTFFEIEIDINNDKLYEGEEEEEFTW